MKLGNVASVLAPTIMRTTDSREFMMAFAAAGKCLVFMLTHYAEIFGTYQPLPFMLGHFAQESSDIRCSIDLSQPL
jgi:hypothetical protein